MFDSLPIDVIYHLSEYLSLFELLKFISSSSSFYTKIKESEDFWKLKGGSRIAYLSKGICPMVFGDNSTRQLAIDCHFGLVPLQIPNLKFKDIQISTHAIALDFDNNVWGWGSNEFLQLKPGDKNNQKPFQIGMKANRISVGYKSTGLIDMDDNLWMSGELGNFKSLEMKGQQISIGCNHIVIIDMDNNVWTQGNNSYGQLGVGKEKWEKTKLEQIPNIKAQQVSSGGHHTLVLDMDNNVWSCGFNKNGQLGLGDTNNRKSLFQIKNIKAKYISAGLSHNGLIDLDGALWLWGSNIHGQLGIEYVHMKNNPTRIISIFAKQIALGNYHTMILDIEGHVWTCGYGQYGQLGLNDRNDQPYLIQIGNIKAMKISAGHNSSALLTV